MSSFKSSRWRSRRHRTPESRLTGYLANGQGCAAIVGDDQDTLANTIQRSARAVSGLRILNVSARCNGLDSLAALLRGAPVCGTPASTTDAVLDDIAAARGGSSLLVIVVSDADFAAPRSLERLRIAAEDFSRESPTLRLVFSGGHFLLNLLEIPQLQGLSTRITVRIKTASTANASAGTRTLLPK